ncbi:hypothetical protein [Goekera deserti]|uniref:Uncharacterized protein n=1 Tax=Goekera deserti TaxID=2497753 RepID=A0A7K3W9D8_9ACTN|nr:hypothetical protein [Goekera deserti]NDI49735.1 hypothetical protein [Goekera deserti]NEL53072.1 hypothetical protein [Goekera deserti]
MLTRRRSTSFVVAFFFALPVLAVVLRDESSGAVPVTAVLGALGVAVVLAAGLGGQERS